MRHQTICCKKREQMPTSSHMKSFAALIVITLFILLRPARAQEPDDQYLRVFTLIEQADSLNTNNQTGAALAKYQEAEKALRNFQRSYPRWNMNVVSFRMNQIEQKIAALSGSAP